ncbi:uncharacterized protein ASCRUDRAFT_96712 [Ascoidea rubescens DSM 1968]|uniref:Uncharacterized protein n=1 Tax=Ascoidea rubescens DSM 1968 TaxID=1344418 RepID=A0A1D2VPJ7_9ASCO|nr:hypothetical protein ASCRUDRAFT_96712 [Ascoidea rubescens DSM 1968]ODV63526.1 hypothetical protein ASCRUDRAFT_96712 [Ascoidea rubescens DSM 1968]
MKIRNKTNLQDFMNSFYHITQEFVLSMLIKLRKKSILYTYNVRSDVKTVEEYRKDIL